MLAVSRAFGDRSFKPKSPGVVRASEAVPHVEFSLTPVPYIAEIELRDEDDFLVIACDGIFDVMTNEEVVSYVRERRAAGVPAGDESSESESEDDDQKASLRRASVSKESVSTHSPSAENTSDTATEDDVGAVTQNTPNNGSAGNDDTDEEIPVWELPSGGRGRQTTCASDLKAASNQTKAAGDDKYNIASDLCQFAIARGSMDNVSVIIVFLGDVPECNKYVAKRRAKRQRKLAQKSRNRSVSEVEAKNAAANAVRLTQLSQQRKADEAAEFAEIERENRLALERDAQAAAALDNEAPSDGNLNGVDLLAEPEMRPAAASDASESAAERYQTATPVGHKIRESTVVDGRAVSVSDADGGDE
jgi:serine/threonine protein phosphatase PrpC